MNSREVMNRVADYLRSKHLEFDHIDDDDGSEIRVGIRGDSTRYDVWFRVAKPATATPILLVQAYTSLEGDPRREVPAFAIKRQRLAQAHHFFNMYNVGYLRVGSLSLHPTTCNFTYAVSWPLFTPLSDDLIAFTLDRCDCLDDLYPYVRDIIWKKRSAWAAFQAHRKAIRARRAANTGQPPADDDENLSAADATTPEVEPWVDDDDGHLPFRRAV